MLLARFNHFFSTLFKYVKLFILPLGSEHVNIPKQEKKEGVGRWGGVWG